MTDAPPDRDWKEYVDLGGRDWSHAILETRCVSCARDVGALIKDGPDPVFVSLVCPLCSHEWEERTA